jgi:hypothetical protein
LMVQIRIFYLALCEILSYQLADIR